MATEPKFSKQPATLTRGAWVRVPATSKRYERIAGAVLLCISATTYADSYDCETYDGRTVIAAMFRRDLELLTPDEAQEYIDRRAARLEAEERAKGNRHVNVRGNFGIRQTRGRR